MTNLTLMAVAVFFLNGCGPTLYAVSAVNLSKDPTTNAKVIMEKGKESTEFLSETKKVAIWPDRKRAVLLAEKLQKYSFFTVVTPSVVQKSLHTEGIYRQRLGNLTLTEKLKTFQAVCLCTGADTIVAFENLGHKAKMKNIWFPPLMKMEASAKTKVFVYNLQKGKILAFVVELKTERGTMRNSETEEIFANAVVKKIIQLHL